MKKYLKIIFFHILWLFLLLWENNKKIATLQKGGENIQMLMPISQWISGIKILSTSNIKPQCLNFFAISINQISFLAGKWIRALFYIQYIWYGLSRRHWVIQDMIQHCEKSGILLYKNSDTSGSIWSGKWCFPDGVQSIIGWIPCRINSAQKLLNE